jgi:hypothetical protein
MAHEVEEVKDRDFGTNWVKSSRLLFYIQVFVVIGFITGGCYNLYTHRYKGTPKVEVPENTKYTPKYK